MPLSVDFELLADTVLHELVHALDQLHVPADESLRVQLEEIARTADSLCPTAGWVEEAQFQMHAMLT